MTADQQKEHLEKMSRLMSVEVGDLAPLAWIRSDDKRLFCPMVEEVEVNGKLKPVYRYEQSVTGTLLVAKPVVKLIPWMPEFQGSPSLPPIWVLSRTEKVDIDSWNDMYGSIEDYPDGGRQWIPVWTDRRQLPLHLTDVPTEADTWAVIHVLKSRRKYKPGEFGDEMRRAESKLRKKGVNENAYRIRHEISAFGKHLHLAGKKDGTSFPGRSSNN